ncbi:hypothetical protein OF83DRAFT_1062639 [Amylostereum chailletii]|nr:hypothetical protein OF83DRAFT_1062639 [Amylostereum chailletii]
MDLKKTQRAPTPYTVSSSTVVFKNEQGNRPIYNGRLAERVGPSISLYNKTLATLKTDLNNWTTIVPTPDELEMVDALFAVAPDSYSKEDKRPTRMLPCISALLGVPLESEDEQSETRVTGVAFARQAVQGNKKQAVLVYAQWKNEFATSGDAGIQVAHTYRKHICEYGYSDIRNVSSCPCILISIQGPYICFFGAVFAHAFIVQPVTEYIFLGQAEKDLGERITFVAQVFHAVSKAVKSLKEEYGRLSPSVVPFNEFRLPRPTYVNAATDLMCRLQTLTLHDLFTFDGRSKHDHRRAMFFGYLGDKSVVVKFCKKYGRDAHELLAGHGLAPQLHLVVEVLGGHVMVVMDYLPDARPANVLFRRVGPTKGTAHMTALSKPVLDNVQKAVHLLHDSGYVFGDLRMANIMVTDDEPPRAMLVDFNWAGKEGEAVYPENLNVTGIKWASDVCRSGLVKKEHDLYMLEQLAKGDPPWQLGKRSASEELGPKAAKRAASVKTSRANWIFLEDIGSKRRVRGFDVFRKVLLLLDLI